MKMQPMISVDFGKVRVGRFLAAGGCRLNLFASCREGEGNSELRQRMKAAWPSRGLSRIRSAPHAWFACPFRLCRALHVAMGVDVLDFVAPE